MIELLDLHGMLGLIANRSYDRTRFTARRSHNGPRKVVFALHWEIINYSLYKLRLQRLTADKPRHVADDPHGVAHQQALKRR